MYDQQLTIYEAVQYLGQGYGRNTVQECYAGSCLDGVRKYHSDRLHCIEVSTLLYIIII